MARVAGVEPSLIPARNAPAIPEPLQRADKRNQPEKAKKLRRPPWCKRASWRRTPIASAMSLPLFALNAGKAASLSDQLEVYADHHIDLPEIKPVVTRVNIHSGCWPHCGRAHSALGSPAGVSSCPGSPFRPRPLAIYLHTRHMVSYNRLVGDVQRGCSGWKSAKAALPDTLPAACTHRSPRKAGRIDAEVRAAAVIASDETSARVEGQTCWQWVFGSATADSAPHRGQPRKRWSVSFLRTRRRKSGSATALATNRTTHSASSLPRPSLARQPLRNRGWGQALRARLQRPAEARHCHWKAAREPGG